MNCDEAFDALTNADQMNNLALKWHLEFCPRCREMQNVLAPALGLLAEEIQERRSQSSNRLAEFLGESDSASARPSSGRGTAAVPFLTPEAVQVAEETAQKLHSPRRTFRSGWVRFAAAAAVCLLAAFGVSSALAPADSSSPAPQTEPLRLADRCLWTEREAHPAPPSAEPSSSRWVVLSCVSCHLEHSLD